MALSKPGRLERTLVLLVTCSMEETRAALAEEVVANLIEQNQRFCFFPSLLVFDNASRFTGHYKMLAERVPLFRASENIGYWSAIYWVLNNYRQVLGTDFDFIYVIESDLIHYDMERLADCESFLTEHPDVGSVRTQEFSVRWRWLYDKRMAFLPFANRQSGVVQYNAATRERVKFTLADRKRRIYTTNFHSKLPTLNRIDAMKAVFQILRQRREVSELDFMVLYHDLYPKIAVLDGGIFRSAASPPNTGLVTGSYTDSDELERIGYENTRRTHIRTSGFDVVRVQRGAA